MSRPVFPEKMKISSAAVVIGGLMVNSEAVNAYVVYV